MQRIGEYLDLYQMKTSSIRYCLNEIQKLLDEYDNPRLEEKVDEALKLNDEAARLEYDWTMTKQEQQRARRGTVETDNQIDSSLSSIHQIAEGHADLANDNEKTELAQELVDEVFPSGVYPITSARFEEQNMHVDQLLSRLQEDFSEHIEALSLKQQVEELAELNEEFGEQLSVVDHEPVTFDDVEAARVEGRDAFHKVFFVICGDYCDDDDARNELLAPVQDQQRRISRHIDRRGQIPEVDPESGQPTEPIPEQPEPEAPAPDEPTAGSETDAAGASADPEGTAESSPGTEAASSPDGPSSDERT